MKCSNCGNEISEKKRFCGHCGASLIQEDTVTIKPPKTKFTTSVNITGKKPEKIKGKLVGEENDSGKILTHPKKKRRVWVFIMLICFLLFIPVYNFYPLKHLQTH